MEKYIIRTDNLSKSFGKLQAVQGIDLKVPEGGVYGFLGPNGAGKSTTIRMLLGLIRPTEGEAFLFELSIKTNRIKILKQVGSMVEAPSYYGHLTAYENLTIINEIRETDDKEIDRVLEIVDLKNSKDRKVKKFSMGMKQRLGIAGALIGNPQLLILDEPTNGLDPAGIRQIRDLIRDLPRKTEVSILVSSHILSEIELMAGHLGIIKDGNLIFQGTLPELRKNYQSDLMLRVEPHLKAIKYLGDRGYDIKDCKNSIKVKAAQVNPARVNRELITAGFEVSHLSREEQTLEDIFLSITDEKQAGYRKEE